MQPRDSDEVGGAGAAQDVPLPGVDAVAHADGERGDDARRGTPAQGGGDLCGQPGTVAVERRAERGRRKTSVAGIGAHVADGTQAVAEEPGLVVEAARVDEAGGPLETHPQAPALADAEPAPGVVPAQPHPPRQARALHARRHGVGVDVEVEAQRALTDAGDGGDAPLDRDVLSFECRRQPLGEHGPRLQHRPGGAGEQERERTEPAPTPGEGRHGQQQP